MQHGITKDRLKSSLATNEEHRKNIAISERTNNEYQANIDRLSADVKRLRNRPAKCVPVTGTATVSVEEGHGRGYDKKNGASSGIRSDWLYEYAIDAESIRIERNSCKDFVNQIWEANK